MSTLYAAAGLAEIGRPETSARISSRIYAKSSFMKSKKGGNWFRVLMDPQGYSHSSRRRRHPEEGEVEARNSKSTRLLSTSSSPELAEGRTSSVFDPEDFGVSSVERSDPKGASAELLVAGQNMFRELENLNLVIVSDFEFRASNFTF